MYKINISLTKIEDSWEDNITFNSIHDNAAGAKDLFLYMAGLINYDTPSDKYNRIMQLFNEKMFGGPSYITSLTTEKRLH